MAYGFCLLLIQPCHFTNHNHVFEVASEVGGNCELSLEATSSEQIPFLEECLENAEPGKWVIGWGHTIELTLGNKEKLSPLVLIDSIFINQPVIIMEQTSHSMWVNSIALNLVGITEESPDPIGCKIMKDSETGKLLGILVDNTGDIVIEQAAWNLQKDKFTQSFDG
jgi:predicted amidohydrolase YtcJ